MANSPLLAFLIKELKEVLPPTLFFAVGFNLIVLTINLILGELRDRTLENQQLRASGLNLVVAAIVLWNTVYLERAIQA